MMDMNKIKELSLNELQNKKIELEKEWKTLLSKAAFTQLEKPHLVKVIKKDLARITMLLKNQKDK